MRLFVVYLRNKLTLFFKRNCGTIIEKFQKEAGQSFLQKTLQCKHIRVNEGQEDNG